jgi:hypothetical protein
MSGARFLSTLAGAAAGAAVGIALHLVWRRTGADAGAQFTVVVAGLFGGVILGVAVTARAGAEEFGAIGGGFVGLCAGFFLGQLPRETLAWLAPGLLALIGATLGNRLGARWERRRRRMPVNRESGSRRDES